MSRLSLIFLRKQPCPVLIKIYATVSFREVTLTRSDSQLHIPLLLSDGPGCIFSCYLREHSHSKHDSFQVLKIETRKYIILPGGFCTLVGPAWPGTDGVLQGWGFDHPTIAAAHCSARGTLLWYSGRLYLERLHCFSRNKQWRGKVNVVHFVAEWTEHWWFTVQFYTVYFLHVCYFRVHCCCIFFFTCFNWRTFWKMFHRQTYVTIKFCFIFFIVQWRGEGGYSMFLLTCELNGTTKASVLGI